jgi:hypothetical protein
MLVSEAETLADMVLRCEDMVEGENLDDAKKVAQRLKNLIREHNDDNERLTLGIE